MISVNGDLLLAQKSNRKPRIKLEFKEFGYPSKPSIVRFGQYDWQYVHHNAQVGGATACCASDGSFIITDGTTITRFATPSLDTDWSTWQATGTVPATPAYLVTHKIIASPVDGEVMLFRIKAGAEYIEYKQSTDYGVAFGGWTNIPTAPNAAGLTMVTACYKPNGDICVVCWDTTAGGKMCINERVGGTWYETGGSGSGWLVTGDNLPSGTPLYLDVAYEDDFLIICGLAAHVYYRVYGDGAEVTDRTATAYSEIVLSSIPTEVNYLADLTIFNVGGERRRYYNPTDNSPIYRTSTPHESPLFNQLTDYGGAYPVKVYQGSHEYGGITIVARYPGLCKIEGHPIILSCSDDGVLYLNRYNYFIKRSDDTDLTDGVFSDSNGLRCWHSLSMCANSEYIFAYNANQIYMSPLPTYWSTPTAGTGVGATLETSLTTRIRYVKENRQNHSPSSLDIVLDNHDNYYDSIGINRGDLVDYYSGFEINGSPDYVKSQTYIVDYAGYNRLPNARYFLVHCVDAWKKLEDYKFPVAVQFNKYTDTYSIYDILVMLLGAIGGTLTYSSRSSDITSIYPVVEASMGSTAASLVNRLLQLVPDVLKFSGLDGTIMLPATSDLPVYFYQLPATGAVTGTNTLFNLVRFNQSLFNSSYVPKYHPILQNPEYRETQTAINSITVIGKSREGDLVYGSYGTEDVPTPYTESMVSSRTTAISVATNIEGKYRLTEPLGSIHIPANIGTEDWDCINVNDTSQFDAVNYRVGGYTTEYDANDKTGKFRQTIVLVGV
jgi:hypothetical protein